MNDKPNPVDLIVHKRDGGHLSRDHVDWLIDQYVSGQLPDYQMAAMAMAIFFRGLSTDETVAWTDAMLRSGDSLEWTTKNPKVDKHSTGGLGDKVSLILAPLLACCGLCVPMVSGRGLGITGGTLDKLESIPGFRTDLTLDQLRNQVERIGCAITGATDRLAPADRKLYALRDVTGTVESIGLITASILNKKLAESLDGLLSDVKVGSGAFMKKLPEARRLARSLVDVAQRLGVDASALLTDMAQPLGRAVGNAVEVYEAIEVLQGRGPCRVRHLTIALAAELLAQQTTGGTVTTSGAVQRAVEELERHLDSGSAWEKFVEMVQVQGGDLDQLPALLPGTELRAPQAGFVAEIDCIEIGRLLVRLGAGRRRIGEPVDHRVGLYMQVEIGDSVEKGALLMKLHANRPDHSTLDRLLASVSLTDQPTAPAQLIIDRYPKR